MTSFVIRSSIKRKTTRYGSFGPLRETFIKDSCFGIFGTAFSRQIMRTKKTTQTSPINRSKNIMQIHFTSKHTTDGLRKNSLKFYRINTKMLGARAVQQFCCLQLLFPGAIFRHARDTNLFVC